MGCFVVHGQRGKGNIVRYALNFLKEEDLVCMVDSDGTYPLGILPNIIKIYEEHKPHIISGTRLEGLSIRGAMTPAHKIGNLILTGIANSIYKSKTSDLCTGYWLFSKEALNSLQLKAKSFDLEAEIFTQINKKKLKHMEVPIIYRPRIGTPPKLKFTHAVLITWTLIKGKVTR